MHVVETCEKRKVKPGIKVASALNLSLVFYCYWSVGNLFSKNKKYSDRSPFNQLHMHPAGPKTNRVKQKKRRAACLYFGGRTFYHTPMLSLTMSSDKRIKVCGAGPQVEETLTRSRSLTRPLARTQTAWNKAAGREDVFKHANPKLAYIHFGGLCVEKSEFCRRKGVGLRKYDRSRTHLSNMQWVHK
jgi:hypothetical protein